MSRKAENGVWALYGTLAIWLTVAVIGILIWRVLRR